MALSSSQSSGVDLSDPKEVIIKINGQESTKELSSLLHQHNNTLNSKNRIESGILRDSTNEITDHQVEKEKGNAKSNKDSVKESPSFLLQRSRLSKITESRNYGELLREGEILKCSSNSSFRRNSTLLKTKTNSRLMDPREDDRLKSKKVFKRSNGIQHTEDEHLRKEDFPEEYKQMKFSTLTILELISLVLIIVGFICTLIIYDLNTKKFLDLELWKWELMVLVLICGRFVSCLGVKLVVFFIERSFLLRKRVCYFVYGLRTAVQNCIWLTLVLVAWLFIFNDKVDELTNHNVLPYVTKIWICLLLATFIWLLKTVLVKVLAMSFHVKTFFDKIHESLFHQYVIETLSNPPLYAIQEDSGGEDEIVKYTAPQVPNKSPIITKGKSKREQKEEGLTIDQLNRLDKKNISTWNMKRMMSVVKQGMLQSTLDEQLRESITEGESEMQITTESQKEEAVATNLFYKVATRELRYICLEDLTDYLKEDEALKTLGLFEGGIKNKRISEQVFIDWVVNVFRERKAIALSLDDTKTAVEELHRILNVIVVIVILIICLLILKVTTTNFFIFLSSQILLVVFVFGNTLKVTFEAMIFVFVMHPFDVGDRIEIDGVMMLVEEMNILTTVLLRGDNQKIIYPNTVLSTKPIYNYNRSPHTFDAVDFSIHISTSDDKVESMKEAITSYVNSKSDHWHQDPMIFMRDIMDMNNVKWSVWPIHTMNYQNIRQRWLRRSRLIQEMIKIFRKLGIEYRMLPHDVNLRNMPPLTSSRLPSNWTTCT